MFLAKKQTGSSVMECILYILTPARLKFSKRAELQFNSVAESIENAIYICFGSFVLAFLYDLPHPELLILSVIGIVLDEP